MSDNIHRWAIGSDSIDGTCTDGLAKYQKPRDAYGETWIAAPRATLGVWWILFWSCISSVLLVAAWEQAGEFGTDP